MTQKLDDIRCLWTGSLGIDYKLCGNNFNCKTCSFDKKIRTNDYSDETNELSPTDFEETDLITVIANKIDDESFCSKFYYLRNHLYLKNLFGDKYYIGITPIALDLLDNISKMEINHSSKHIKKGEVFVIIEGVWGSVLIHAPFDLEFLWQVNLVPEHLHPEMWLGLIQIEPAIVNSHTINYHQYNADKRYIREEVQETYGNAKIAGATLFDGGKRNKFLYECMGKNTYKSFLQKLFLD